MVSKIEINDFAKRLNKVNRILWKAVYEAESLIHDEVYTELFNASKSEENIIKLAKFYKKISEDNEDFVSVEHFGATFDNLKEFADKLIEIEK